MRFVADMRVSGHTIPVFVGPADMENDGEFEYDQWRIIIHPKLEGLAFLHTLLHEWRHARFYIDGHSEWEEQEHTCDDFARCAVEVVEGAWRATWMRAWDRARDGRPTDPVCLASLARIEEHLREPQETPRQAES